MTIKALLILILNFLIFTYVTYFLKSFIKKKNILIKSLCLWKHSQLLKFLNHKCVMCHFLHTNAFFFSFFFFLFILMLLSLNTMAVS